MNHRLSITFVFIFFFFRKILHTILYDNKVSLYLYNNSYFKAQTKNVIKHLFIYYIKESQLDHWIFAKKKVVRIPMTVSEK